MKFVFGTSDEKAVEYVNQEGGSIGTPVMGALVEYEFDTDDTFQLVIENRKRYPVVLSRCSLVVKFVVWDHVSEVRFFPPRPIWAVSDNGSTLALHVRGKSSILLRSTNT